MIFSPILKIGPLHFDIAQYRRVLAARCTKMQCLCFRKEDNPPVTYTESSAPIEVVGVHPKARVKHANVVQSSSADYPEAPVDDIHVTQLVVLEILH